MKQRIFCAMIGSLLLCPRLQAQISATNSGVTLTISSGITVTAKNNFDNTEGSTVNNYGTLEIQGALTSSGTYNPHTGTTIFSGTANQNIPLLTYYNLSTSGSATKTISGNITVNGNLNIGSSTTLDAHGTGNYAITLKGNWTNSGTFTPRSGRVTFNGTANQVITSSGQPFYDVTINNSATQVSLSGDLKVSNLLTLTDGVITTGSDTVIITNSAASALTGHSSASFVNGNLKRYFASNTGTYAFPVSKGTAPTSYNLAEVVNHNLTGISNIYCRFKSLTNHHDYEMNVSDAWLDYGWVNTTGVWQLSPNAAASGGTYDIKLYTANIGWLVDNQFAPLKRPTGSTTGADWSTGGGTLNDIGGAGRMTADGYALRMGLSSFSDFGVGGSGAGLPITLLSFHATADEHSVVLLWVTASEINNDYFTIEKSNGGEFVQVAIVPGAGNSSTTKYYSIIDDEPFTGISYYRLTQTDFDGAFDQSDIVSVQIGGIKNKFTVYPNPVEGDRIFITLNNAEEMIGGDMYITDMKGRMVFADKIALDGVNQFEISAEIAKGLYIITISNDNSIWREKLVVN